MTRVRVEDLRPGDWLVEHEARVLAGPSSGIRTQPDETFVVIGRRGTTQTGIAPVGWRTGTLVEVQRNQEAKCSTP